jgi:hypothetical protein
MRTAHGAEELDLCSHGDDEDGFILSLEENTIA